MLFPSTALRDNFNRTGPNLGSNWSDIGATGTIANIDIISSMANGASNSSCSVWVADGVVADQEAYVTLKNIANWGTGNWAGVCLRLRDISAGVTYDSYRVRCLAADGSPSIVVERVLNDTGTNLTTITGSNATFVDGDGIGARMVGSTLSVWRRSGATGIWTKIYETTDATYADGYPGMVTRGINVFVDDFGGGEFVPSVLRASFDGAFVL